MTIGEADKHLKQQLKTIYDDREATNITNIVMENLTGFTKSQRLINKLDALNDLQLNRLRNYIQELLANKPVQYVLHEAWFAGLKFYVDENVLIPRPETEELVALILGDPDNKNSAILDVGTGSGCIAISIKNKFKNSKVYALDISLKAIEIASKNAIENSIEINFIQADILNINEQKTLPFFDIIVSNPPYIRQSEAVDMHENVLKHEPSIALFVTDENPLIFYEAIAAFALQHLNNNGKLYFEINEAFGTEIVNLLYTKGFSEIDLIKDLQGKQRIVTATLKIQNNKIHG